MSGKKELISISQAFANMADALERQDDAGTTYYPEYQSNPLGFMTDVLGIDQWDIPNQIIESVWKNSRTTVRSCHASSKSFSAAAIAITFLHTYRPSTVITTAPGGRQAKEVIWAEIHDIYHKAKKPLGGRLLQTKLQMSPTEKWVGLGFAVDEDRPETLQGYHNKHILIIVDEASGVARPIFEAIEGLLSSGDVVRLLLIGNPNDEATLFGDSFKDGSIYVPYHISAFDTPNFTTFGITEADFQNNTWKEKITSPLPRPYLTSPSWAYDEYKTYGPDSPLYMVRVRGDFPPISEDTLIPLPWLEKAIDKKLPEDPTAKTYIGVDVARFGTDESVLTPRKGDQMIIQKAYNSLDGFFLADKVEEMMATYGVDASNVNVDEIGIGGSPIDFLKHREKYVKGINVSSKASDVTMYVNIRAEMYYNLRNKFKDGTISIPPKSDLLVDELSKIKYKFTNGKIQIEDKKEMKKRMGKSPDRADSLAMAYYEPKSLPLADLGSLQKPKLEIGQADPRSKIYDEDVYAERMNGLFTPEVPVDIDVCPKCQTHIGLEYRDSGGRSDATHGTDKLCLICRTKWKRTDGVWVEQSPVD